jgi:hypothetical protein
MTMALVVGQASHCGVYCGANLGTYYGILQRRQSGGGAIGPPATIVFQDSSVSPFGGIS